MVTNISTGVAEVVAEMMRERDTTQVQLAELSAIPRTTLQRRLVDGDFTVSELARISVALRTTPDAIFAAATDNAAAVA